jgi:hypothetical protein
MARKTHKPVAVEKPVEMMYAVPETCCGDYCLYCAEGFGEDVAQFKCRPAYCTETCGGCERTLYYEEKAGVYRWFNKGETV